MVERGHVTTVLTSDWSDCGDHDTNTIGCYSTRELDKCQDNVTVRRVHIRAANDHGEGPIIVESACLRFNSYAKQALSNSCRAFNKVKALVEAFSMIVKTAGSFAALVHIYSINLYHR